VYTLPISRIYLDYKEHNGILPNLVPPYRNDRPGVQDYVESRCVFVRPPHGALNNGAVHYPGRPGVPAAGDGHGVVPSEPREMAGR